MMSVNEKDERDINTLVNTSVSFARASLSSGNYPIPIVARALSVASGRKQKTISNLLSAYIKRAKRELDAYVSNRKYPTGSTVHYYPVMGDDEYTETKTTTEAWDLPSGHTVVKLDECTGGISIHHLRVVSVNKCTK